MQCVLCKFVGGGEGGVCDSFKINHKTFLHERISIKATWSLLLNCTCSVNFETLNFSPRLLRDYKLGVCRAFSRILERLGGILTCIKWSCWHGLLTLAGGKVSLSRN